jgi:signal transduction histidine kinase
VRAVKRRKPTIIVIVSLLLGLLFLYSGDFPWSESAHVYSDFSKGPTHYEISLLLLYVVIVYASIVFRTRIGIIVAVLVTLALVPQQVFKLHDIPFFRPISYGTAAILTAWLIGTILNRRDQAKEAYDIQQSLARQVVTVRETEKQSLAHELHDVVLQKAVDIAHEIDDLLEEASDEVSRARLKQLRTDIGDMMEQTRQVVRDLRPPMLDEIGLVGSLKELADSRAEHGIEITLSVWGKERRLPDMMEAALFRIAEEALNNVRRHSEATRIEIVVEFAADQVRLQLSDNGVGFVLPTYRELVGERKFGVVDMSERARLAGGNFHIESTVGRGTVITVEMPVQHQA